MMQPHMQKFVIIIKTHQFMTTFRNILLLCGILLTCLFISSCEDIWNRCIDGNGTLAYATRELQPFEKIQVNGDFEVQIDTGSESSVVIKADENLLDLVVTHVSGDQLIIEPRNNDCLRPSHRILITVTTPVLSDIHLDGSGYIHCQGLETDELAINLQGSGEIMFYSAKATSAVVYLQGSGLISCGAFTENLTAQLEGSGEITMNGASVNADLKIIGSGRINADQMTTDVCYAYISGSGRIDTQVNNALDITIIGSGMVVYRGNPTVESYISGSGKVIHQ